MRSAIFWIIGTIAHHIFALSSSPARPRAAESAPGLTRSGSSGPRSLALSLAREERSHVCTVPQNSHAPPVTGSQHSWRRGSITLFTPLSRARAAPRARPRIPRPPGTIQIQDRPILPTPGSDRRAPPAHPYTALTQTTPARRHPTGHRTPTAQHHAHGRERQEKAGANHSRTYSHQRHTRAGT